MFVSVLRDPLEGSEHFYSILFDLMSWLFYFFFFFKQKTAYEIYDGLVGSEICIRDR